MITFLPEIHTLSPLNLRDNIRFPFTLEKLRRSQNESLISHWTVNHVLSDTSQRKEVWYHKQNISTWVFTKHTRPRYMNAYSLKKWMKIARLYYTLFSATLVMILEFCYTPMKHQIWEKVRANKNANGTWLQYWYHRGIQPHWPRFVSHRWVKHISRYT